MNNKVAIGMCLGFAVGLSVGTVTRNQLLWVPLCMVIGVAVGAFLGRKRNIPDEVAYFAGGCFWGMEKFMSLVPGVTEVISGYANGNKEKYANPDYDTVCSGLTGYKEAVKVSFNTEKLSYEKLVRAYFLAIDPTVKNRQGNDVGEQYQTGIYYTNNNQQKIAEKVAAGIKEGLNTFAVEIEPFDCFFAAEEYHQKYLVKNPTGYCHISDSEIRNMLKLFEKNEIPEYKRPTDAEIEEMLTPKQYEITQKSATEPPFKNEYWDFFEKGIYVDIVSGEPLFSSEDKYKSSCGWPAFSFARSEDIQYIEDLSDGMVRTEVRSGIADSHLGHVFESDPESPTGKRYCINSASLEFIPYNDLVDRGYRYAKAWFKEDE